MEPEEKQILVSDTKKNKVISPPLATLLAQSRNSGSVSHVPNTKQNN